MSVTPVLSPPAGPPLPAAALRLGYLALVPFAVGALLVWLVRAEALPYAAQALSAYAAVVVSFLGGVPWGLALRHGEPSPRVWLWGAVPPTVAWVAVMMPASSGLVLGGAMLVAGWLVDRRVYAAHGAGAWLTLRFRVGSGAALCCFIAAAGT